MMKKKTFALRVDSDILSSVEKWASDEFRSVNGQLEWIIYNALKDAKRLKKKAEKKTETENQN
ncbi:MAG: Arc family DNA binding domain-containing protein [Prolixibacteraceae bacterium]|nr:Arc family DNA binding domain-containing protein [Prolixibacteraceae bacterium]